MENEDKIYCYKGTDVLKNNLDIKNNDALQTVERRFSTIRTLELYDEKLPKQFDFNYLKHIHKKLFSDIYSWAGEIRKVDISKGIMFARNDFIKDEADRLFNQLKKKNYLKNLDKETLIKELAYFKTEINMLHPFREGNGRATREFIKSLAKANGYEIDFSKVSKVEYANAMVNSPSDTTLLENLLRKSISITKDYENEICSNTINKFKEECPAIQEVPTETVLIINNLTDNGQYFSIADIKKDYKKIGKLIDANKESKADYVLFEKLDKVINDLKTGSRILAEKELKPVKAIERTL